MLDKLNSASEDFDLTVSSAAKADVWKVEPSAVAKNCRNLIREVVDTLDLQPNPAKSVIALSLGDPTIYGNLAPPPEAVKAVVAATEGGGYNGYAPSVGYNRARSAVADYVSYDGVRYEARDVILCSGCSSALEMCITVLADSGKGQNILIPRPGFSIYRTLAEAVGVNVKYYDLIPENNWEADLQHLEDQVDAKTAAIVVVNPSNPCGSVYSGRHLADILDLASKYRLPVIADEIYERLVFPGTGFVSVASLHSGVPILICGGLAKRFLAPGWRLGWILLHDEVGAFDAIREGLTRLSQRTIGSNTLIQGALADIFKNTPQSFHEALVATLHRHALVTYDRLCDAKGLTPYMPDGAMYMLVEVHLKRFPEFETSLDFVKAMMEEESVFCLPGDCFGISGFVRIVLTVPEDLLMKACDRIRDFCNNHYRF
ncbi:tyrosine aminotransferase [Cylas formicarius]|uniref:tyrosine aminotransferase n=1 Tax=Cylas formicarius TaxID=197179 RepID=UPI002958C7A6|nr:tyrosine aminotransferase [Cylas formicarius]